MNTTAKLGIVLFVIVTVLLVATHTTVMIGTETGFVASFGPVTVYPFGYHVAL